MNSRASRIDTGVGVSFIASAVIHLAVFLLLSWWGNLFPTQISVQETYYVDVVNLPVSEPRSGSTEQQPGEAASLTPPAPVPTLTPAPAMTVPSPSRTAAKIISKAQKTAVSHESFETEAAFAERMAKLERNTDARHEEAVLEKLQRKAKTGGVSKSGTPGASGAEAGSRYADYVKSRLEDALKITSSYSSKNPEVAVRLTIGVDGRLVRMKIERSSGDAAFELAVRRAIDLASEKFTEPPNHTPFDNGFVFKPKGITNSASR
jgi:colicin import membrane protein